MYIQEAALAPFSTKVIALTLAQPWLAAFIPADQWILSLRRQG
jgi:hypothetical protein